MNKASLSKKFITGFFLSFLISCICAQSFSQQPTGLGIVRPTIKAGTTLYLYSGQLIDELLHHNTIKDSITFIEGKYNIEISSAPPWFVPEHIKTGL